MDPFPMTPSHDRDNISYFDEWAKKYDQGRITKWFQYTQSLTIGLIPLRKDSIVLDVGCGTGFAVMQLASMVSEGKACGIDISPEMVEQAKRKVPDDYKERVEFQQASSDNIPYSSGMFDHLLCTNSFHHYPDPHRALKEMSRVLKPGGQLVIFENAPDLSWYTWAWDRFLRVTENGHVRYYPSKELEEILKRAGLKEIRLCYLKNEFLKHGKLFASIQVWSAYTPSSAQHIYSTDNMESD